MHTISRRLRAYFDEVVDFWRILDRPIMFPAVVGGHCLIPNTGLLLKSYDSEFLRLILSLMRSRKWKIEIEDESVRREVEKVKEMV